MNENDKASQDGLRCSRISYAIDTDDIGTSIPESTNRSRTPKDAEDSLKRYFEPNYYESPLTIKSKLEEDRARKESDPRISQCRENEIYESSYDEVQLNGRHYTGYYYASNTDGANITGVECHRPRTLKQESNGFWYDNPLRVTEDEIISSSSCAETKTRQEGPRSKENAAYEASDDNWTVTSASASFKLEGIRNINRPISSPQKRQQCRLRGRRLYCFLVILFSAVLAFACWVFVRGALSRKLRNVC